MRRTKFTCDDCDSDNDCPQIKDEIWLQVSNKNEILCVDCLEARLGRKISLDDFADVMWTRAIKKMVLRAKLGLI